MRKLSIALITFGLIGVASAGSLNYSAVAEANSARIDNVLVRYLRIFEDPCLYIETVSLDGNWGATSRANVCDLEGRSFSSGFTYAGFQNISFEVDGIHLTLSTTPLEPTEEEKRKCFIPVTSGQIGRLHCSEIKRAQNVLPPLATIGSYQKALNPTLQILATKKPGKRQAELGGLIIQPEKKQKLSKRGLARQRYLSIPLQKQNEHKNST